MRCSLIVVAILFAAAVPIATKAQPRWTLGPSVSFGYGWTDGQYDYVGDDVYPTPRCGADGDDPPYEWVPFTSCVAPLHVAAAYGGGGATLVGEMTPRFAWASTIDVTIGGTHRIGDRSNAGVVVPSERSNVPSHDNVFLPYVELAYRLGSTVRVRVGARRRGYLGAGARVGYRMQLGSRHALPNPRSPDPNAPLTTPHLPRGFTLEALLEGGIQLDRVSIGILGGAGRPRFRAELVLTVPFAIDAR